MNIVVNVLIWALCSNLHFNVRANFLKWLLCDLLYSVQVIVFQQITRDLTGFFKYILCILMFTVKLTHGFIYDFHEICMCSAI